MAPRKTNDPGKTTEYYRKNPEKYEEKLKYDTKDNKDPKDKKYRADLAKERRKRGVMGKGGKDMSHTKDGKVVPEDPKANRARKGKK